LAAAETTFSTPVYRRFATGTGTVHATNEYTTREKLLENALAYARLPFELGRLREMGADRSGKQFAREDDCSDDGEDDTECRFHDLARDVLPDPRPDGTADEHAGDRPRDDPPDRRGRQRVDGRARDGGDDDLDRETPIREVACAGQSATTVAAVPGDHDDRPTTRPSGVPDVSSQRTAGVLHHLEQPEADLLDGDTVDRSHLVGGYRRHLATRLDPERASWRDERVRRASRNQFPARSPVVGQRHEHT
jgi:hypothetical protein